MLLARDGVGGGGEGPGAFVFNMYGVLVWDDENVLEADGGDGYVTVNVLMPPNFKCRYT